MKITNTRLMEIVKEEYQRVLSEKKVKNPGPYIDGPRAKVSDRDGDGVPDGADEDPMDGDIKEAELDEEIEIID
jgi:hypothetical protein